MGQPYVGECRMVGFSFAPVGWSMCQGQLLPISENDTLFALLGTTYGGDGEQTFQLPNLAGRAPVHQGSNQGQTMVIGEAGGVESVTLTAAQIPVHTHPLTGSSINGNSNFPQSNVLAASPTFIYVTTGPPNPDTPLNANAVSVIGGSQPHDNMQPYLTINWIISLFGIFPQQN